MIITRKNNQAYEFFLSPEQDHLLNILAYIMNSDLIIVTVSSLTILFGIANHFKLVYHAVLYFNIALVSYTFIRYIIRHIQVIRPFPLCITGIAFVFIFVSLFFLPELKRSFSNIIPSLVIMFFICIPTFIMASRVKTWSIYTDKLKPFIVISAFFSIIVYIIPTNNELGYNDISLSLLFPTIAALAYWQVHKRKWACAIFVLNVITVLLKGSRGTLLCTIGALLMVFIWSIPRLSYKRLLLYLICISTFIFLVIFWPVLIKQLSEISPDSRSIYLLSNLSDKELFLTGRSDIYDKTLLLISKRPFTGYGIFGAGYYLSKELGFDSLQKGVYAHNLILDFILHYGVIIGLLLSIIWFYNSINVIRIAVAEKNNLLLPCLWVGYTVFLLFSGTYISDKIFWFLAGFLISRMKKINVQKIYSKQFNNLKKRVMRL